MNDFAKESEHVFVKSGTMKRNNSHFVSLDKREAETTCDLTDEKLKLLNPLQQMAKSKLGKETKMEIVVERRRTKENPCQADKENNNNDNDKWDEGGKQGGRKICKDFEQILDLIGSEGKYQKILLYAILCPIVTISPFLVLNGIFMLDIPDHWCHVPGKDANMSVEEWKNLTLPWEMGPDGQMRHSQCTMYDNESLTGSVVKCKSGWEYDTTDYSSTIPSEFNWVCDKDHYATDCFTWTVIGSAIGTVLFGILADKIGRKPVFLLACLTNMLFNTASLFVAHRILLYKFLQLLAGLAYPTLVNIAALISAEISRTEYRGWVYVSTWMVWVVGNSLIPILAMICRDWFVFGCVAAAPGVMILFCYPFLDESPRWLITSGNLQKAIQILSKIAKINEVTVDEQKIEVMANELANTMANEQEQQYIGLWTLFSRQRLAKNTIMLIIAWTMSGLLYDGITLNTTHMAGNKFINYFLLALIELPGGWLAGKLIEVTGRRWTQVAFFVFCALSCFVCGLAAAYPNSAVFVITAALGIKFGVAITSIVSSLQATEIFPTQLRSTGTGLASTVSSTVGIFGPYIVYSGTVNVSLPYFLFGICSLLGLLAASWLPETFQQNLPEKIDDANNFGKSHKFWSYLPHAQMAEEEETDKKTSIVEGGLQIRKTVSRNDHEKPPNV